jgi:pyruvate/2-oxoglutarate/acetoin dehydrogenase E1 component
VFCPRCSLIRSRTHGRTHSRESGNLVFITFPGFRLAPPRESGDHAGLAGMTIELPNEVLKYYTRLHTDSKARGK